MSGCRKARNDLTLAEQYQVCKLAETKLSQHSIASQMNCSQSQVHRILSKRSQIMNDFELNSNTNRKRQRTGKYEPVEDALLVWYIEARSRNLPVSGPVLEAKADMLAEQLGIKDFKANPSWIHRWKTRNSVDNVKAFSATRDGNIADSFVAADRLAENVLPKVLMNYRAEDIYNCSETGLYYRAVPLGTLEKQSKANSPDKKCKETLTVLVCSNMTGTDKRKLLVIGHHKRPTCFKGASNLPVEYDSNKKAWMTADIFMKWVQRFDLEMARKKRNILLVIDHNSAHPIDAGTSLSNIVIRFLPNCVQPCEQGIVKNLKVQYRMHLMRRTIGVVDAAITANAKDGDVSEKTTVLDAIHMLQSAWNNVRVSTVQDCFRKAGFYNAVCNELDRQPENIVVQSKLTDKQLKAYTEMDEGLECCGEITAGNGKREQKVQEEDSGSDDSSEEQEAPFVPSAHHIRGAMFLIKRYLECHGCTNFDNFFQLQCELDPFLEEL